MLYKAKKPSWKFRRNIRLSFLNQDEQENKPYEIPGLMKQHHTL